MISSFDSVETIQKSLLKNNYLADRKTATTIFLAVRMQKPVLVEGPAGVGKTYLARSLAAAGGMNLIRLQCYPGLDEGKALYEWNYQKQLIYLQSLKDNKSWDEIRSEIYTGEFLLSRPVLKAFMSPEPAVLLIDEADKSDDEMESFLLEALSEYQVTIPEMGTVHAVNIPLVIITSNNSRDFSDAMKRRCLHLYMPFPDQQREEAIIRLHIKDINSRLAGQVAAFLSGVRKMALRKSPGIAETIDWAKALMVMGVNDLDPGSVRLTLNALVKYEEDIAAIESKADTLIQTAEPVNVSASTQVLPGSPEPATTHADNLLARFDF
ncbi:MAG: AAA family ATPase [Bacillota bacterium]